MNVKPENIELVSNILTFLKITHTKTENKITIESDISPFTKTIFTDSQQGHFLTCGKLIIISLSGLLNSNEAHLTRYFG